MTGTNYPHLTASLIYQRLQNILEKDWRGRHYVRVFPLIEIAFQLYVMGVSLGYVLRENITPVWELAYPKKPSNAEVSSLQADSVRLAKQRTGRYMELHGQFAETLQALFVRTEMADFGAGPNTTPHELDKIGKQKLMLSLNPSPPLDILTTSFLEGIGLGSGEPELARQLWESGMQSHERDAAEWSRKGLNVSTGNPLPTIEEAGQVAIDATRDYIRENRPTATGTV